MKRRRAPASRSSGPPAGSERRLWRRRLAAELAAGQGGVLHRRQLLQHGVSRVEVHAEVAAGRWSLLGRHTLAVGAPGGVAQLDWPARGWWAVWESGPRAALDGVSALRAYGLTGWTDELVHVSLPRNCRRHPLPGVRQHVLRVVTSRRHTGLPRAPVETAVLHAAQWAASDRQAATLVAMVVQQRLVARHRLLGAWGSVRRSPRRQLLDAVIRDVCDGAQSMGELDFAGFCRRRGIPRPSRQEVRVTRTGRVYLDVWWDEQGIGAEIEGAHHTAGLNAVDDALRQNAVLLDEGALLRIPVLGLRVAPDQLMEQVAQALATAGTHARRGHRHGHAKGRR